MQDGVVKEPDTCWRVPSRLPHALRSHVLKLDLAKAFDTVLGATVLECAPLAACCLPGCSKEYKKVVRRLVHYSQQPWRTP
eukprot:292725-Amphidinium_carterae.2